MYRSLAANYDPARTVCPQRMAYVDFPELPFHDTMWSLSISDDGVVYAGVCGELTGGLSVHLYAYDPRQHEVREIADYAQVCKQPNDNGLAPQSKIHYSMCPAPDGKLYTATHCTGAPWTWKSWSAWKYWDHPKHGFPGAHLVVYDPATNQCEDRGIILPNEGCRVLKLDRQRMRLHAISFPRSHYYVYDLHTGVLKDLGRVSCVNPQALFLDRKGNGYTTDDFGYIVRCNADTLRLELLPTRLPAPSFCPYGHNTIYEGIESPDGKTVYGVTWSGQPQLFAYYPEQGPDGRIEDLGPAFFEHINRFDSFGALNLAGGLTIPGDGYLYLCPHDQNVSPSGRRMTRFHLESRTWEDLGLIDLGGRHAPFISEGVLGRDGTIYMAEDVASPARFYVYRPPSTSPLKWTPPHRVLRDVPRHFPPVEIGDVSTDLDTNDPSVDMQKIGTWVRSINQATLYRGAIELRPLNRFGRVTEISADAMSILGMTSSRDGKLFAVTGGDRSHFISYEHIPRAQHVLNHGVLHEGPVDHAGVVCRTDGTLIVWITPSDGNATQAWSYAPEYDASMFRVKLVNRLIPIDQDFGRVVKMAASGGVIACLCADGQLHLRDEKTLDVLKSWTVAPAGCEHMLIAPMRDRQFAFTTGGEIKTVCPQTTEPRSIFGSDSAHVTALAAGADRIAFGLSDGTIGDIVGGQIIRKEKAGWQRPVRCLCITDDGTIWGVAGTGVGHLYRFAANDQAPVSYETPATSYPYWWVGYEINHLAPAPRGAIYMGETGRLAHLFIYYPDAPFVDPSR